MGDKQETYAVADSLRALVHAYGASVLEHADQFVAAMDDFVGDEEVRPGERSLLADAVRLGSPRRVAELLGHGADAAAAVHQAGAELDRARGGGAPGNATWVVALLARASGVLDPVALRAFPRMPESAPAGDTVRRGAAPTIAPAAAPTTRPVTYPPPPPPAYAVPTSVPAPLPAGVSVQRRRSALMVALVALALALATTVGIVAAIALNRHGTTTATTGPTTRATTVVTHTATATATTTVSAVAASAVLPDQDLVMSQGGRLYSVDSATGAEQVLTEGPGDLLPTISPDRRSVIFMHQGSTLAWNPELLDVATGSTRPLFDATSDCAYGTRPGYSLDGTRIALWCTTSDQRPLGLYLANADGSGLEQLARPVGGALVKGAPTWISDDAFVYTAIGTAGQGYPEHLVRYDVSTGATTDLTDGSAGWDSHPDYSAESGTLLFLRANGPNASADARHGIDYGTVWAIPDGGEPSAVGPSSVDVGHPAWSPDGTQVTFSVISGGVARLAVAPFGDLDAFTLLPESLATGADAPAWGSR